MLDNIFIDFYSYWFKSICDFTSFQVFGGLLWKKKVSNYRCIQATGGVLCSIVDISILKTKNCLSLIFNIRLSMVRSQMWWERSKSLAVWNLSMPTSILAIVTEGDK